MQDVEWTRGAAALGCTARPRGLAGLQLLAIGTHDGFHAINFLIRQVGLSILPSMSTSTTKSAVPEGPRVRLLRVADRLFYRKGYSSTGINELIEEAGIAKASFYQHFSSKTDLIVAYLRNRHEGWFGGLTEIVERHDDVAERVLAVFDWLVEWLRANDFRGCAFLNTIPEFSDASSLPRQIVRKHKQELRTYLTKLCTDAGRPEISDQVFLLLEGAMTQAAVVTDMWPVTTARELVWSLLNQP